MEQGRLSLHALGRPRGRMNCAPATMPSPVPGVRHAYSHLGASLTPLWTRVASHHLHLSSVITSLRSLFRLCSLSVPFNTLITPPRFSFRGIYSHVELCRKGDPFQRPKGGSCLTLGSELSEKTHMLIKQETLLGRGARWRAAG